MHEYSITALVGRVPVDGAVSDPFLFQVVIGADNLTANGNEPPEVAGSRTIRRKPHAADSDHSFEQNAFWCSHRHTHYPP